jgi:hypothetical protein
MQGILGEIIREILAHDPGMEIIDDVADLGELLRTDELHRSDVVIGCLAEGSDLPLAWVDLLHQHPRVKLLIVSTNGRHASLYCLRLKRLAIDELSPSALIEAVREPVPATAAPVRGQN